MFKNLGDIPSIGWRENKEEEDGLHSVSKNVNIGDYVLFEGDKSLFETERNQCWGGWVTDLNSSLILFSTSHPRNRYHSYDSKKNQHGATDLHKSSLEIARISKYSILFKG